MLDVRRMQVLRAVVTSGSVSSAAASLGYTPSAVSQQIATLEKEAGTALLERIGRRVQPTGRLLAEHAAIIGRQLAEAETALTDLRAGRTGRLAIGYFTTAGAALVAPALARFRRAHPDVLVDLKLTDPEDPLQDVIQGRTDLAVVVRPRDRGDDVVHLVHLLDDPYRAVLPKGHRLAAKRVIELADLAAEPWVGSEWPGPCLDALLEGCATAGFAPHVVVDSEDYASAQGFVAAGLGISLIPELGLANRHPDIVVRRVRNPQPSRAIQAAVRKTSLGQPALRGLLAALGAAVRP